MAFDSGGLWSFDKDFARNAIVFVVDNLLLTISKIT